MSPAIKDLRRLPVAERILLVQELWDSIAEDALLACLTSNHKAELDQRLDALEAQSEAGTSWQIVRERILINL